MLLHVYWYTCILLYITADCALDDTYYMYILLYRLPAHQAPLTRTHATEWVSYFKLLAVMPCDQTWCCLTEKLCWFFYNVPQWNMQPCKCIPFHTGNCEKKEKKLVVLFALIPLRRQLSLKSTSANNWRYRYISTYFTSIHSVRI